MKVWHWIEWQGFKVVEAIELELGILGDWKSWKRFLIVRFGVSVLSKICNVYVKFEGLIWSRKRAMECKSGRDIEPMVEESTYFERIVLSNYSRYGYKILRISFWVSYENYIKILGA